MHSLKSKIALLFFTIFILFTLGEVSIRILSDTDLDDNIIFRDVQFKPYKLPRKETAKKLRQYLNNEQNSRLLFDKELGWISHSNFVSSDSMYIYNNDGIRSASMINTPQKNDAITIMFFGDSYTHGDEVNYNGTIEYFLQKLFWEQNKNVQVLNFAVSGYGMDQVLLRWEKVKNNYDPDIVVFGIQFENVKRNINIIRSLYSPVTQIPFTKPRFIIKKNKLILIDNSAKRINDITNILNNFDNWELKEYEGFYNPDDYESSFFYNSQLISFTVSALDRIFNEREYFSSGSESYDVTVKLINRFKLSVEEKDAEFVAVHLPVIEDFTISSLFSRVFYGEDLIYKELLDELKQSCNLIETYSYLKDWSEQYSTSELFMARHYSPKANNLIAKRIYNYLNLNYEIFSEK